MVKHVNMINITMYVQQSMMRESHHCCCHCIIAIIHKIF